jgi:hypothetical protein
MRNASREAGLELLRVESDDLVFDFPNILEAAKSLVHTGRFALLLKDHPEWIDPLTDLTMEHFSPYEEPSGRVRLSNRYHLFVLRKKLMNNHSGNISRPQGVH